MEALGRRRAAPWPSAQLVVDPSVSIDGNVAVGDALTGRADMALARWRRALDRAAASGSPMDQLVARWGGVLLFRLLDDVPSAHVHAQAMHELVGRSVLAQGEGPSRWFLAWTRLRLGMPGGSARAILEAHEYHLRAGMLAGATVVHELAAEAFLLEGDAESCLGQLDRAECIVESIGETLMLPSLRGLRAQACHRLGRVAQALDAYRDGLAIAERQQAPWHALRLQLSARASGLAVPGLADDPALLRTLRAVSGDPSIPLLRAARESLGQALEP